MNSSKRYAFNFLFVFDQKVEQRFLSDVFDLNATKLEKLGYEVQRSNVGSVDAISATVGSSKLADLGEMMRASQDDLLHFSLYGVSVRLTNTLLPDPDQKQQEPGSFKYRDGVWKEEYGGTVYEFVADEASRVVVIGAPYEPHQNHEEWKNNFVYVLKSVHHSAFLARRVKELCYAMGGKDEAFNVAAQGRMMAAIAYRLV